MITRIATAAVYTGDEQKALDFWTRQVGFVIHHQQRMTADASWTEVGPKGAESCIVIYPRSLMQDWTERKPSIVFECDDLSETYEEMKNRGVRFTQEPRTMPWGLFAIFEDSDGNSFGLRESRRTKATGASSVSR
jgi:lactoylglutathione lyase